MSWFPTWRPYTGQKENRPVATNEYLPPAHSLILGLQHTFAMFGATVLAPVLMGFNPNLAILMSGLCTILFFIVTQGRVPSYLGSSFSFIAVVAAVTGHTIGSGVNLNLPIALGGIIICGLIYAAIGGIVMATGTKWVENLMPPVVTGAVVMIIGLNLAPVTIKSVAGHPFEMWMALITVLSMGIIAVFSKGLAQRLLLLIGLVVAYIIYFVAANVFALGTAINFEPITQAAWFGLPQFIAPVFQAHAILVITPIALILIAENLGHIKAVGAMTGEDITPQLGKAFFADGLATTISGNLGAPGMTTYGENIGVMAVTRVYSSIIFVIAGSFAVFLGLSPKFGAIISTIPTAILAGASIVVFGLITIAGAKIWIENKVDFSQNKNLIIAAVPLILGAGNFELLLGQFNLGGIGTATFIAIFLNWFFNLKKSD